ncbi:MAG: DUF4097 domain-containing protein [Cytophagales bacterium]|nr:DUF4097 domain-containing protein [Cytophagales bacterium]
MKNAITGLVILAALSVQAQEYKYAVKGNAAETWVNIEQLAADLSIEGTSGSEIKIVTKDYDGLPEKAQGLKALNASGSVDNTDVGLSVVQDGNTITITSANREANDSEYTIYLPKALNLKVDYHHWSAGDLLIKGMAGQVEAKAFSGDLELIDVTGPITANTLSSDLVISFSSLSQSSPSSLSSTSGDIEISMPSSVKGTFKMSSMSGGVYTDLDFDMGEEKETRRIVGSNSTGKLNGGGVEVLLRTISGDVYIRKTN